MQKFSRKYSNREYAPGLALYGVDGMDGVSGESGRSLFVCQYNIDENDGAGKFGNAINQGLDMTSNDNSVIGRPYMNGDVFIFSTGYLYRIDNYDAISTAGSQLTAEKFKEYMSVVGVINITESSKIFSENTKRLVLDTDNYKGFIVNMSTVNESELGTIDSPLTILSDNETGDGRIYFMGLKSIYAGSSDARLSIYYDVNLEAYVLDSDKDILIDADVRISPSENTKQYAGFSMPVLSEDKNSLTSFSGLCSHLSWKTETEDIVYTYKTDDSVKKTNEIYASEEHEYSGRFTNDNNDGQWNIVASDGYKVKQFNLKKDGTNTDYIKICIVRKYGTSGSFDFTYTFTDEPVGYNGANFFRPDSGYVNLRQTIDEDGQLPESWSEYWWKYVKKAEPVYPETYWDAQMFLTPLDEKIYLPKETSWLVVTAPDDVYVMVYGDGSELYPVDAEIENKKIDFIRGNSEKLEDVSARTGYDQFAFMTPRYERKFTFSLDEDYRVESENGKYDVFKNASFHITGVYNKGNKAGQRVMEYYVKNTEDKYPCPTTPSIDVSLYGDYSDDNIDWYVSLFGDNYTEFFIKQGN